MELRHPVALSLVETHGGPHTLVATVITARPSWKHRKQARDSHAKQTVVKYYHHFALVMISKSVYSVDVCQIINELLALLVSLMTVKLFEELTNQPINNIV